MLNADQLTNCTTLINNAVREQKNYLKLMHWNDFDSIHKDNRHYAMAHEFCLDTQSNIR